MSTESQGGINEQLQVGDDEFFQQFANEFFPTNHGL